MSNDYVFSWAENAEGKLVHVDSVPNGLQCGCKCPYCHETLLARHGSVKEHGFAHHSENRGANLKICYAVVMYKLAEQILQTKKRVHVPSYIGIFKESEIEFADVKIDSRFEREDKQPDVVATTNEGKQYLIEFVLRYKVQHKQTIDYKNLTCLEIDLSNQTLESVEDFLLHSNKDRRWMNNDDYFNQIESVYSRANKHIRIVSESECNECPLVLLGCCAVRNSLHEILIIDNNGQSYRLCKPETYELAKKKLEEENTESKRIAAQYKEASFEQFERTQNRWQREEANYEARKLELSEKAKAYAEIKKQLEEDKIAQMRQKYDCERTCFECRSNLTWANRGDFANCGCYISMRVPKNTPPDCAMTCKGFKKK